MKNVEDVYALTPMQEVMLLHTTASRSDDVLFNQFCFEIRGPLNVAGLEEAWRCLCQRHDILRSAFLWENLKQPVQVVRKVINLPFECLDWRDRSEARRHVDLEKFRQEDRSRGFDPAKAPMLRVTLIRCDAQSYYYIWSSHHLLLDRWCLSTVFRELGEFYQAVSGASDSLQRPAIQYREYIRWIRQQDPVRAEEYWRGALAGLSAPTPITCDAESGGAECSLRMHAADVEGLRGLARKCGVTIGVLVQGVWSLVLNRLTGLQDVAFGMVAAGRPPDLPGVEAIIGSFINNVPVRVRIPSDESLAEWLRALQSSQHERGAFEYVSPGTIQRRSALPLDAPLFDTLLVWLAPETVAAPDGLEFVPLDGEVTTAYPLTLSIEESVHGLTVHASLKQGSRALVPVDELLEGFRVVLADIATATPETLLGTLSGFRGGSTATDLAVPIAENRPEYGSAGPDGTRAESQAREAVDADIMEELLRAEWQAILGNTDIESGDDFFALGGSSMQALSLHARIQSVTQKSLPLLALYRATTLRGMSATLASGDWPLRAQLVMPVRDRGSQPPLFCIASPEVNTVGYVILARYLGAERPVYVLQAPPDFETVRQPSPAELPELAATYVEAMRRVQSTGPFCLLGMCTGAELSLEMARLLEQQGERVAFAGVVDTWALYTVSWRYHVASLLNRGRWYVQRLSDIVRMHPAEQLATIRAILSRRRSTFRAGILPGAKGNARLATPSGDPELESLARGSLLGEGPDMMDEGGSWIHEFGWTRKDPHRSKYPGTMTVFRIHRQPFWRVRDPDLGWGRHVERVEVEYLPGDDHHAILREPVVGAIGERLETRLRTVFTEVNR